MLVCDAVRFNTDLKSLPEPAFTPPPYISCCLLCILCGNGINKQTVVDIFTFSDMSHYQQADWQAVRKPSSFCPRSPPDQYLFGSLPLIMDPVSSPVMAGLASLHAKAGTGDFDLLRKKIKHNYRGVSFKPRISKCTNKKKTPVINYTMLQRFRFPFCLCDLATSAVPMGLPNNVSVQFTRGGFVTKQTQWSCSLWADLNTSSVRAGSCIWHHFFCVCFGLRGVGNKAKFTLWRYVKPSDAQDAAGNNLTAPGCSRDQRQSAEQRHR